ncbi:free fatty acid receptor 4 isoform X3 [Neophocaena asiaeorientalis asiaeorientalis]|uniref:Free fatty acid receptor 4 isoform X3 n=1 Tax=Neophocaena asiaeorientalis asiaeorientalis TaxID=1706337 RepID=A0A341AXV0_NEOAA|nr:free fatty acid receptor 4 isoform X3 [Neophocaena asiaeorientalis asiaeorientalis]XP_032465134.1 free fatty acid receptor 4 isoform X3 [Phocoena sinus]
MSSQCAQAAGIGPARSLERTNRTRFPFFSDVKGDHRLVLSAVETVVLALIFAVSLLGNVCALVLVARRRRRGTTASLVLNLFCADLLFTSAIPPVLAVRWTEAWVLGPGACHLLFYVMTLSGSVTILTLAAVSLERMVCIVRLQRGVRRPGRRARAALLALIWGYSAFAALPLCIFFRVVQQRFSGADEITKASRRRLTMTLASSESHQLRVSQQDVRLFRTLFLLMISFFVMWSPIIVTILLILIQNFEQNLVIWPSLFFWVVAFTFANSAVNPILYNMSLFRNEWRKFFHCFFFSEKGAMFTDTSVRRNDLSVISS